MDKSLSRRFKYIGAEEAQRHVVQALNLHSLGSEHVPITATYGRILAEDIVSPIHMPPHDMSHFDGYAIRAIDASTASVQSPMTLTVIGEIFPGQVPTCEVRLGEACYVTTGGFLPQGADSVVAVEATRKNAPGQITIQSPIDLGDHVIPRGSDITLDQTLFRRGHQLRAQDLNLIATLGIDPLTLVKKPRVAIVCVGDELTELTGYAVPENRTTQVVNSHRYTLAALIQELGGDPIYIGIASDDLEAIQTQIANGLDNADIIIVVGGSSMGAKDLTATAINTMGVPGMIFHGVKRKPGRVSGFAVVRNKPIVLLPGLCHSLVVGFHLLVAPMLRKMSGHIQPETTWTIRARLMSPLAFTSFLPFEQVTFVNLAQTSGGYIATPCSGPSSSVGALIRANAFIITPPRTKKVPAGALVQAYLLPGFFALLDLFTPLR
jgi:molybdopterin molybdotransferase